jgi:hypothetical protein
LNRVWSNKARCHHFIQKSLTWEAQIYNALDEADISTLVHGLLRLKMIRKHSTALAQEGGFGIREKKEIFLIFTLSKLYQIMTKRENTCILR